MVSRIQFDFNADHIEARINKAKINTVLNELRKNTILYFMGFNIQKNYCCVCDKRSKCEICIRGNEHISAKSDRKLVWVERAVLKHIAGNFEKKYA